MLERVDAGEMGLQPRALAHNSTFTPSLQKTAGWRELEASGDVAPAEFRSMNPVTPAPRETETTVSLAVFLSNQERKHKPKVQRETLPQRPGGK